MSKIAAPGSGSEARAHIIEIIGAAKEKIEQGGPAAVEASTEIAGSVLRGAEAAGPNTSWLGLVMPILPELLYTLGLLFGLKLIPDKWMLSPFGRPKPAGTETE